MALSCGVVWPVAPQEVERLEQLRAVLHAAWIEALVSFTMENLPLACSSVLLGLVSLEGPSVEEALSASLLQALEWFHFIKYLVLILLT